ncbi:bacteriohemerythrin [Limnohabitans sp.]|jgi:hemerythrin-like metal-binding protein|uniref:bacteriohemerythrin n=1 Tax=Limnohabitans sp. TaxID=1907725 RepID=UPI0037C04B9D
MSTTATSSVAHMPPVMAWTDSLHTGDARMDETHQEFVDMINQILATPEDQQLPVYKAFLNHTVEHFAQEERWMLATGFSADNCHAEHHATILETMRVVEAHYLDSDKTIITRMAEALAEWFPGHAGSMDAGLAAHLKSVGFNSESETLADPSAIQTVTMSGCGSVSCS